MPFLRKRIISLGKQQFSGKNSENPGHECKFGPSTYLHIIFRHFYGLFIQALMKPWSLKFLELVPVSNVLKLQRPTRDPTARHVFRSLLQNHYGSWNSFYDSQLPHFSSQDLRERLQSELSGDFGELVDLMFYSIPELKAQLCYDAIKGAGTDELALIEVICTSTNSEIEELKKEYAKG